MCVCVFFQAGIVTFLRCLDKENKKQDESKKLALVLFSHHEGGLGITFEAVCTLCWMGGRKCGRNLASPKRREKKTKPCVGDRKKCRPADQRKNLLDLE